MYSKELMDLHNKMLKLAPTKWGLSENECKEIFFDEGILHFLYVISDELTGLSDDEIFERVDELYRLSKGRL